MAKMPSTARRPRAGTSAVSVGFGPDGRRLRRKVSGKIKQEVISLCAGQVSATLDLSGRLGSAIFHRGLERGVVALVLVGVGFGEVGDRLVELCGAAEVGGQGDAVAGAGVRPGQGPPAQAGGDPPSRSTQHRAMRKPRLAVLPGQLAAAKPLMLFLDDI
jgi:hypothetical protein